MLHIATVSPILLNILRQLMQLEELNSFRLVGGTALALQMGHRTSVDIDLFTDKSFDRAAIIRAVTSVQEPQLISQNTVGLTIFVQDIKVDICNWAVPFIGKLLEEDGIRMSSPDDIAAFKLDAITDRKDRKDFYDLYFLLQQFNVEQLVQSYRLKYPYNNLKDVFAAVASVSLADDSPSPMLLLPLEWEEVKQNLINVFNDYIRIGQSLKETAEIQRWESIRHMIERKTKKDN